MLRRFHHLVLLTALLLPITANGQAKRALDHDDVNRWMTIQDVEMTDTGTWVAWVQAPARGDGILHIRSIDGKTTHTIHRGQDPAFSGNGRFVMFRIVPEADSVRQKKLDDVPKKDMPTDSLGILDLFDGSIERIAHVQSFGVSDEDRALAFWKLNEEASKAMEKTDSTEVSEEPSQEPEEKEEEEDAEEDDKPDKKKGVVAYARHLDSETTIELHHVTDFLIEPDGNAVVFIRESEEGTDDGVYALTGATLAETTALIGEGNYARLALSEDGLQMAFLTNQGDFLADQPSWSVYAGDKTSAQVIAQEGSAGMPPGWWVSENQTPSFSDSGKRLYFGSAPRPDPDPEDDDILDEEKVNVDIWNWKDPLLQPMQLVQLNRERDRSYQAVIHLEDGSIVQLATEDIPDISLSSKGDGEIALGRSNMAYRQEISWDSPGYQDAWVINTATGERSQFLTAVQDTPRLSPEGGYVTWWDRDIGEWMALDTATMESKVMSEGSEHSLVNELHDWPYGAGSYGSAGWTEDDAEFVMYDKYDLLARSFEGDLRNVSEGAGRATSTQLRYQNIDFDEPALPSSDDWLLRALNMDSMDGGYWEVDPRRGDAEPVLMSANQYRIYKKAEDADVVLAARSSFREFPDLQVTDMDMKDWTRLSDANPQQADFSWGTSELVEWTSLDGEPLKGILYKPDGFDASNQYPMMVYFYEKSSTGLHRHIAPSAGGSSINYSFYVSRGYLLFVPDIPYKVGYPGESAMNAIMPGITSLIDQEFVDRTRIGVQGHSWGGYQIAYMVTQTNLFVAAEAGAPVSNMTSAYGGIRWASGMSRMFQYERTQSRIGGTLWNAQQRYIHNSPLFQADKVKTPVLMMHNDDDGAVPWYQGIEFFVALRRLGQPVWMLNYNGEGHGLSDLDARRDWQIRMQQFFDHYLIDAPAPVWLEEGVPALKKGKTMGFELVDNE